MSALQLSNGVLPGEVLPMSDDAVQQQQQGAVCHDGLPATVGFVEVIPDKDHEVPLRSCVEALPDKDDLYGVSETLYLAELGLTRNAIVGFSLVIATCWALMVLHPEEFGTLSWEPYLNFVVALFFEMLFRAALSYVVLAKRLEWPRVVNYTRKIARTFAVFKIFVLDEILPKESGGKTACNLLAQVGIDQLIFVLMFCQANRRRNNWLSRWCKFAYLCYDRPEDRPDSMRYEITENVIKWPLLLAFLFAYLRIDPDAGAGSMGDQSDGENRDSLVYIPLCITTIGDGLAEPVGVWGSQYFKRVWNLDVTFRTKSLYTSEGGFWSGDFRRSYPGSLCVFLVSIFALIGIPRTLFDLAKLWSPAQFIYLMCMLPFWATVTEAVAPHTCDGPFLICVVCGLIIVADSFMGEEVCGSRVEI